ncbi:hypothetical protein LVD17_16510 [Fulvivirga ulvae]|uniref:hypothetical protein n=1 Tax=Fulvivirga ulvae TaxID=2904245 RepID=UPI001F22CBC1|nr:hypothetical protein [Fulvivirga ulvae]UII29901.1 hypothetical protein LVD17_16510 [Fulvivirga ulvae]
MAIKYRLVILIFIFSLCTANGQPVSPRLLPEWFVERYESLELDRRYELGAYLNPLFLEGDFNGDGEKDIVSTLVNSENGKLGLLIIFKSSEEYYIVGAGDGFGVAGDSFEWVDYWEIFDSKTAYETTFLDNGDVEGTREVTIRNVAISIRESEGSGGLIYYDGEKFTWIHQGE